MDYQVRNDIPLPPHRMGSQDGAVPALKLLTKVGESVLLNVKMNSIGILTLRAGLTGKYAARKQPDGSIRVWRTKL